MKSIVILILCIAVVVQTYGTKDEDYSKPFVVQSRTIQDDKAVNGQFPYVAYVKFFCAGNLIAPKWVLTATYCFDPRTPEEYKVYLGDIHRYMWPLVIQVSKVIQHPEFEKYFNVVCLLELEEPVTFTDNIKPIRLPDNKCDEYVGEVGTIAGFGGIENPTSVLHYADVKVISNKEYQKFPSENLLYADAVESGNQSSCYGVFGSGLVLRRPDGDTLIGLLAFHTSHKTNFTEPSPTGFIRVNYFLDWIIETANLDM